MRREEYGGEVGTATYQGETSAGGDTKGIHSEQTDVWQMQKKRAKSERYERFEILENPMQRLQL